MNQPLRCWRCSQLLQEVILPLSRREECAACGADQHVCKLCQHYRPGTADDCNEDRAEPVSDKEHANFCDYFTPQVLPPGEPAGSEAAKSRAALAELFGDQLPEESPPAADSPLSEADAALAALNELFNKD